MDRRKRSSKAVATQMRITRQRRASNRYCTQIFEGPKTCNKLEDEVERSVVVLREATYIAFVYFFLRFGGDGSA